MGVRAQVHREDPLATGPRRWSSRRRSAGVSDEVAQVSITSGSPRKPRGLPRCASSYPRGATVDGSSGSSASRGQQRVVVVGLAVVVEGVPDRERDAEEPLAGDQPVAVEAADPVVVAVLHVGGQPGDLGAALDHLGAQLGRRGRRCGCTTGGWRRSRAACRPSRRSSPSAGWAWARRRGRRTRAAGRPSPRGRENAVLPASSSYAAAAGSRASHSGVSRCSRPSRPITVRTGRSSSRHQVTSVRSPKVQHIAMPAPLSGSAGGWASDRDLHAEHRGGDGGAEQRRRTARRRGARSARPRLGISSGRVVSTWTGVPSGRWNATRW